MNAKAEKAFQLNTEPTVYPASEVAYFMLEPGKSMATCPT